VGGLGRGRRDRERESRLEFGSVGAEEAAPKTSEKDKQMIGPPSLPIHFLTRARGDSLVSGPNNGPFILWPGP
jgi:hypothetical protein